MHQQQLTGRRAGGGNGDGGREKEIKFPPAQRQFKIKRTLRRGLSVFSHYWIFLSLPFRAISSCVFFLYILFYIRIMPTSLSPSQREDVSCMYVCVQRLRRYRSADERASDINIFFKKIKQNEN